MMVLKKGGWLKSNRGENWKIVEINGDKFTIRKYYKGSNVGTIDGLDIKDLKKCFKVQDEQ